MLIILLLAVVPGTAADLQGKITFKLAGASQDQPLPQAIVSVYNTTTKAKVVTQSSDQGLYRITSLPTGKYIVLVEKNGRRLYQGSADVSHSPGSSFDIRL